MKLSEIKEEITQIEKGEIAEWYNYEWSVTDLSGEDLIALANSHTKLLEALRHCGLSWHYSPDPYGRCECMIAYDAIEEAEA